MPHPAMPPQKKSVLSCFIDIGLGHVMCSGQLNVSVYDLHPLLSGTLHSTGLFHSIFCVPVPSAMRTAYLRRVLLLKGILEERLPGENLNLPKT